MNLKKRFLYKFNYFRRFFDRRDFKYLCGKFEIILPFDHRLPAHKEKNQNYDRFLGHLSYFLPKETFVIDVGANCGDTLAIMLSNNNKINYFCIEADKKFMKYLEKNTDILRKHNDCKIILSNSFIGKEVENALLDGEGGTKHAIITLIPEEIKMISITLDKLISKKLNNCDHVSLLKIDVDGYDYDVINSAMGFIMKNSPILFFECYLSSFDKKKKYEDTIINLSKIGYSKWVIFDNFGGIIFKTEDVKTIFDVFNYIWKQNINKTSRTIYYIDILACKDDKSNLISEVLSKY